MRSKTFSFPFTLLRVIDGDTIEGTVDLGFHITRKVTVRIAGINTPELHGAEKEAGLLVKKWVEGWLNTNNRDQILRSFMLDKFGRVLGDIRSGFEHGDTLTDDLLWFGLAQTYGDKGERKPFSADHLTHIINKLKPEYAP